VTALTSSSGAHSQLAALVGTISRRRAQFAAAVAAPTRGRVRGVGAVLIRVLCVSLASLIVTGTAKAHLLPKLKATMNIVDSAVYCVVAVPATALKGIDDDGNGLISTAEIQGHNVDIQRQFEARFHLSNNGATGVSVLSWVLSPDTDGSSPENDYVVVMHRANFAEVPTHPALSTDLFGTAPGEQQFTVTATHGVKPEQVTEAAVLEPGKQTHTFFRGRWSIFADFIRVGFEHILTGPDHLLFLLTIVVAAAGWRYWLGVVTSFTIAHSITLALSALGVLRVPSRIVEPGIAASIVIMALLNLRLSRSTTTGSTWCRIGIVFACGLLHGFGFGSAIGAMAVDTGSRIATLAGFNVGIEIGQFLFVAGAMLLVAVARPFVRIPPRLALATTASIVAAVLGTAMLVDRLAEQSL
jgi:hydrogenase/urease accessory protein HupE